MSDLKVYYLGVGSATPSLLHQPSCQVVDFRGRLFMLDCGEGAQLSMRKMKLKYSRLEHIFISHLHGDHFFGLSGLLSTMALHDIGGDVTVHIPEDGVEWLSSTMDRFCSQRSYRLKIEPICKNGGLLYEDDALTITAFPLTHRVPCTGFLFRTKPGMRHLRGDMAEFLHIPVAERYAIKQGADFITPDGRCFENSRLTTPGSPSLSYAYCSDTAFNLATAEYIRPVDVIYHESTYLETEKEKAKNRYHSTAAQAVKVALAAEAKELVLGHYSKSYSDTDGHMREARSEAALTHPNLKIVAATEGMVVEIEAGND